MKLNLDFDDDLSMMFQNQVMAKPKKKKMEYVRPAMVHNSSFAHGSPFAALQKKTEEEDPL